MFETTRRAQRLAATGSITALAIMLAATPSLAQAPVNQPGPALEGVAGPGDAPLKDAVAPLSTRLGVKLPNIPVVNLDPVDVPRLVAEDAAEPTGRLREGVAVPFKFHPAMGDMHEVPGGGWLWVLDVHAPGSYGVRLHLADFSLPAGAEAIVYDPKIPDNLPSPYTGKGPDGTGEFWAWTSWSDTARIEVYYPKPIGDARFNDLFTIDQAIHMYRNPMTGQPGETGLRELGCHNDLTCFPNWVNVGGCVGRMSFVLNGSSFACSGAMMNNTSSDLTPYFMTARHCMQDNTGALNSLTVYWFYQRDGCTGSIPVIGSVPRSDRSTYVRTDNGTDMSMVMIEGTVPRNLWWTGNNSASMANGTALTGIHHPGGTRKRISFGTQYDWPNSCAATSLSSGFRVDYTSGTTEPGSSGSPLFISNGAFVGVDSCGFGTCPGSGYEAVYGSWFSGYGAFQSYVNNPGSDDSYENNDTCGAATNLNSFFNGTLYSLIVKSTDEDWYRITVPAFGNCSFHINFTHGNGDIDMALHDGCGGVLASSAGTTDNETVTWTNPGSTAREVYLRVYLFNDTRNIYYLDFARYGATAPSNDSCANAVSIPAGGQGSNASGNTTGATTDGSTNCSTSSIDVWYKISAPCTRTVSLNTQTSAFDTVLSVHTGCPGTTANQVACNDDVSPGVLWSSLSFTANGGQTYYVRVAGYQGAFGSYNLDSNYSYASNDLCANSIDVPPGSYQFNNCTCETDGPPDDACLAFGSNQIYRDFWLGFIPDCYGTIELNTIGSNFDTKIAIYANANNATCPPGPNSAIACNDDISPTNLQSQTSTPCVPGQRYVFRIGSFNANVGQAGLVNIIYTPNTPCIPPPPCAPDLDHDGQITPSDIAIFINLWSSSIAGGTLEGDFDGSGTVDPSDIATFINAWLNALTNGCP
ncbi:MAG: hypothetical protein KF745_07070 [Phycisphaeraceae bacterium]|nr:hypothetical protein [Phycisphaeraceae bacterium]